ncbi:tyrosine-type recombinase/integrase [Azospirillum doebereinerae]|uniref:tyrosine-type recombinase/integrase n=1 Tax=Azospirillum doebereinerae TaxID=92933 RepID=UPI001FCFEDE3
MFDTLLKGFVLKVTPKGAKVYLVIYRMGGRDTPKQKVTIGRHGSPWTPDQARTEAEKLLASVKQGTDPAAEKKARTKRGATVSDLADSYLTEHVEVKNKASTATGFRRLVEKEIKPALGKLQVDKVTRADVAKLHHDMRDTPRQANQTLAVLSKMFGLAEVWGMRPDETNPCKKIERYRENKRERFLSTPEVERLGKVLAELDQTTEVHETVLAGLRLLLLTGCRLGEVLALRWDDVVEGAVLIRDGKAGARIHTIGALAQAFLADLPRTSVWVLPAPLDLKKPLPNSTISHAWGTVRTKAGLEDVHLHDLRHTVGTYAGQTGANAFLVRDKLGHKTLAMTGRYVNRDANPLRELSDKIEGRIMGALNAGAATAKGEVAGAEVASLPETKKRKRAGVT